MAIYNQQVDTEGCAVSDEALSTRAAITSLGAMEIIWVVLCFIGASLAYALHVSKLPLWSDELAAITTVRRPFVEGLLQLQDYAAPMYQLLLRLFVQNDYPPAWVIRAPAVVFALLGLLACWWLARVLFGRRVAALSLALLTVNMPFARYAMEGRPYSMFLLFSAVSMVTFYRLMYRGGFWYMASYVASTTLLLYSHYYGFLVIPAQVGYAMIEARFKRVGSRDFGRIAMAFGLVTVFAIPALWLISRYLQSGAPGTVGWLERPDIMDLLIQPGRLLGNPGLGVLCVVSLVAAIWWQRSPSDETAPLLETSVQSVGMRQRSAYRSPALLCVLWVVSSLYLLLAVSHFIRPVYQLRYGLPAIVPLIILSVVLISRLRPFVQVIILMLVLFFTLSGTMKVFQGKIFPYNNGYPQLVAWLHQVNDDQSPVFVTDWAYCDGFINPEAYGMRYYGSQTKNIKLLPLRYPYQQAILNPNQLTVDSRFFVVGYMGRDLIDQYLKSQPRDYRTRQFGHLWLYEAEKEGSTARWLQSSQQSRGGV
jgi:4-amino-4-deoxy-L-arabinose transferase-like glycosyltransferase